MADVGNLIAKLTLDTTEFSKGTESVEGMLGKLAGGVGNALGSIATAVGAAVAGAAAGVASLVTESVKGFGELEQLAGGAQKIFDEIDYSQIEADANAAWKSMGLSANEYLAMINQVGASFAATMGDKQGYEVAKQGMQAISDYASGTGRNVEELNEKFSMITRSTSSYQSIADQFSGILPATSAAFLEQAQAVGVLDSSYTSLTQVPIAEYQQAVSAMLEQGVAALNLTENTAKEAETTLTGSFTAMQKAWDNLVTAMSSGGEALDQAISDFLGSAETFIENLMPVITRALEGIAEVIQKIAPVIAAQLPSLIASITPLLLDAAISIVRALVQALPELIDTIGDALISIMPQLMDAIFMLIDALLTKILPKVWGVALKIIVAIAEGIADNLDTIIDAILDLIPKLLKALVEVTPDLIRIGGKIVLAIAEGILKAIFRPIAYLLDFLGIIEGDFDKSTDKMANQATSTSKSISDSMKDITDSFNDTNSELETFQIDTSEITKDTVKDTSDLGAKVQNTTRSVKEYTNRTLTDVVMSFDNTLKEAQKWASEMLDSIDSVIEKLTKLGEIQAAPSVDASGVTEACQSIVDACNDAMKAMEDLGKAGGSAGGGGGGGRALGGSIRAGGTYLVGELGPELITPTQSGWVHTAEETQEMLGGRGGIIINITGDVYDDERSMRRKLKTAVLGVLQEQVAYG